jgi:hypothetical protein
MNLAQLLEWGFVIVVGVIVFGLIVLFARSLYRPSTNHHQSALTHREPVARGLKPLSPVQLRNALNVDDENPLWRAMHQCMEEQKQKLFDQTMEEAFQERPQVLAYLNGGANFIEEIQEFMLHERDLARKEAEID